MLFEFRIFPQDDRPERAEWHDCGSEAGAKAKAGRLAVANDCPVDAARFGRGDWSERYLTTASPSEYHVAGYRFERIT